MNQKEMEKIVWGALADYMVNTRILESSIYQLAEREIEGVANRWHGKYNNDRWLTEAEERRLRRAVEAVTRQVRRRAYGAERAIFY